MQRSARRQGARAPSPDPIDYHQRAARPVAQGDADHAESPLSHRRLLPCRRGGRPERVRAVARHLLQLPAGMGRLGLAAEGHPVDARHPGALRQQELRPGHRRADRREGQSGGGCHLPGRHLRPIRPRMPACSRPTSPRAGTRSPPTSRTPTATGSPSTRARSACSSTRRRSAASRCRRAGRTCSSPNTRASSAISIRPRRPSASSA